MFIIKKKSFKKVICSEIFNMGNLKSKTESKVSENNFTLNIYSEQLKPIIEKELKNITKEEQKEIYLQSYEKALREESFNILFDKKLQLNEKTNKQLILTTNLNIILEQKCIFLTKKIETISKGEKQQKQNEISPDSINIYIDELLRNQEVNIDFMPDYFEKQIYQNTFSLLLNIVNETFKKTSLDVLGHEIKLTIEPKKKS